MKYFIDTEFIEGFKKPLFGKRRHFIDLISIGIVAEDGRTYYAVSNEFNPKDADNWVRENVIDKIEIELYCQQPPFAKSHFNFSLKELLKQYGKSNKQIAEEIIIFINQEPCKVIGSQNGSVQLVKESFNNINRGYLEPEFYGYYSDYDWVLFCSLFGRMIDLPKGFPMYCIDLKQILDEKANLKIKEWGDNAKNFDMINHIKTLPNYPRQEKEHNALDDAKWNLELFKFLQSI